VFCTFHVQHSTDHRHVGGHITVEQGLMCRLQLTEDFHGGFLKFVQCIHLQFEKLQSLPCTCGKSWDRTPHCRTSCDFWYWEGGW